MRALKATVENIPEPESCSHEHLASDYFSGAFHNAAIGMALVSESWQFLRVNESLCRILGYTEQVLIGAPVRNFAHPEDADIDANQKAGLVAGQLENYVIEKRYQHCDGSVLWIRLSVSMASLASDGTRFFIAQYQDFTQRKALENDLRAAKEAAEAADEAKTSFLARMSHEIRTPMNAVIGFAELLQFTTLDTEQQGYVDNVMKSGEMLLGLINDVLDLSKIESNAMTLEQEPFDVAALMQDLVNMLLPRAEKKGLDVVLRVDERLRDCLVMGDAHRLRQVLVNLISNGIKFTRSGSVALTVEVRSQKTARMDVGFEVTDTGVGIEPAAQEKIFTPFGQASDSITREFGGTGLGLAIAQRLVQAMGGMIHLCSQPQRGSTFAFTIPLRQASFAREDDFEAGLEPSVWPEESASPARVLVVEDNPTNQELILHYLRCLGLPADLAQTGRECLTACTQRRYELILMDIDLPELDGIEATRKIREQEAEERRCRRRAPEASKIVAVTAHAFIDERERCMEAGMDGFLSKPLRLDALRDTIAEVLHQESGVSKHLSAHPFIGCA